MSNSITLTASMRSNLSALKSLAEQMGTTQKRLSTGKKVNSAIDNASSFYQSRALTNRAGDLDSLLDNMGQGIQIITTANESIEAGLSLIEQMKSVAETAATTDFEASYFTLSSVFDGRSNTQAIVGEIADNKGISAEACNIFYAPGVAQDDENFGQGHWYLPSVGELIDLYNNKNGSDGVNAALTTLYNRSSPSHRIAATIGTGGYWSSTESTTTLKALSVTMNNGTVNETTKSMGLSVRTFSLIENKFETNEIKPVVGNVMYSDLSYGAASDYDGSKTAVGVVTWVSDDGGSVRIVNLKDLKFSSFNQPNSFDPADPYRESTSGGTTYPVWCTTDTREQNIEGIEDIAAVDASSAYASGDKGTWVIDSKLSELREQFNAIYEQYNNLIDDASYQGINLLKGNNLNVFFNESRSHTYTVQGKNADAASLGVSTAYWNNMQDIEKTITQLQTAVSSLRNISEELGNSYSVVETRQNFTDALIDVLQTGSDDLVLADMNEESANYLALQTRQQLAVNSLSLASQSAQSILKLF